MNNRLNFSLLAFFIMFISFGQQNINPKNIVFNSDSIKDETYAMQWFIVQDTIKHELGSVVTKIQRNGEKLTIITDVKLPQATKPWVDSTVVAIKDFSPIYHSSYNQNRDMAINYGNSVSGYHLDNKTGKKIELNESPTISFFDSSSYPQIIKFLPLIEGFTCTLDIFDFNPNAKTGTMAVHVKDVSSAQFTTKTGEREVWKVYVTDDISDNQANIYYYIEKSTGILLQQEVDITGRKMVMIREGI
jgi:hypothetical protein